MTKTKPESDEDLPFDQRVRIAAELLESLDRDRGQLVQVSEEERQRVGCKPRRSGESRR